MRAARTRLSRPFVCAALRAGRSPFAARPALCRGTRLLRQCAGRCRLATFALERLAASVRTAFGELLLAALPRFVGALGAAQGFSETRPGSGGASGLALTPIALPTQLFGRIPQRRCQRESLVCNLNFTCQPFAVAGCFDPLWQPRNVAQRG